MSLNKKILSIAGVIFFATCIVLILHLLFSSLNDETRKSIFIYLSIYGSGISAKYIFQYRNAPNYGISISRAFGSALGLIGGFYFGYQICILVGIFDGISPIQTSNITVAIGFGSAELGRQVGNFLGYILLPI
ncbi:MAG: hypothetical protein AAFX80_00615 [Cyanobacteria bacterium J06639_18]